MKKEGKKYIMTADTIVFAGIKLSRIKALRDFGNVKKGELGGYISSEKNLSHYGTCWVSDNAQVRDNAFVGGSAQVRDRAIVCDFAIVRDLATVSDIAVVGGYAVVDDDFSKFGLRSDGVTCIMIGIVGIPPDTGVKVF